MPARRPSDRPLTLALSPGGGEGRVPDRYFAPSSAFTFSITAKASAT
jgi:hypothetical protein